MGNAPLPSPPKPTEHRVVMPITTKRKFFGTKLSILPLLQCEAPSSSARTGLSVTPIDSSPEDDTLPPEMDNPGSSDSLPPQLRGGPISTEAYNEKLQELRECLAQWKGGWATVAILCFSLIVVLGFIAAYLTPAFWSSAFFDHPGYICAMGVTVVSVFTFLIRYVRREAQRLQHDVEDLYRPWRGRGVRVTMKRVANVGNAYSITQNGIRRVGRDTSGKNCFCVIMDVVNEDIEGGDAVSVGTVLTEDSDD